MQKTSVTDGQTDGHQPTASTVLCIALHSKNLYHIIHTITKLSHNLNSQYT